MARSPRVSPRLWVGLAAAVTSTLALTGCSGGNVTAAAFPEPAVTLQVGVNDQPGRYIYDVAEEFARRATEASEGALVVEVVNTDIQDRRWNQKAIELVREGAPDLLVVPSQAFDAVGVDTLAALHVPFLISDEEHLDAVATSNLTDDLLAGVEEVGLTGLALVPGGMRRLVNEIEAPTRPADIAGDTVRVAYSETIWGMFEEYGARPDDPNGAEADEAYLAGLIDHVDSIFQVISQDSPKTVADVTLYPWAYAVVANSDVLAALSDEQAELLARTAREVAQWAADTRTSEADEARSLCARVPGAEVVLAGQEARAEWRAASEGYAAELRSDPVVDELADRIEAIGAHTPAAEPVPACSGDGQQEPTAAPPPNVPSTFPEGGYRKDVSAASLMERGLDPATARGHTGVWTLTFRDGVLGDEDYPGCPGSTYEIVDDRIVVTLGPEGPDCGSAAGRVLFSAGWRLEGDSLTFTDVRSGHGADMLIGALFGGEPWTRIG
jgi:TRAP-type C4-dicarboxylate transport system substrate-binding protein